MAAGRCEICNKILYLDSKFGDDCNFAENAHIHAVGSTGPRHKSTITQEEINDISNLMLLCSEHHHLIDTKPKNYSGDTLVKIKKTHENRIRRLTEIKDDASCSIVTYFSNIDNVELFSEINMLRRAVVNEGFYPKNNDPIELHNGISTRFIPTKEAFLSKSSELETQIKTCFRSIVKEKEKIAVFAIAPQSLLFKLGTLLNDQLNVSVFQAHRDGDKWTWPNDDSVIVFSTTKSKSESKKDVALVIDLSAEVVDSRVISVLGEKCSIYHLSIEKPNRYFVKNTNVQFEFVKEFRRTLEMIKNENPKAEKIHLFPVMPSSLVVRAGMDYMPKADLPLVIYEQFSAERGFEEAILIGG